MDRRHFAKLSAFAAAATQLPAQATRRIGYAAVGLGDISDIFMRAVADSQHSSITGLVTGHPAEKGPKFAAKYNVPHTSVYTYETFDRIRDNKSIDAVYIGLPNSMHCDFTVRAAEAGKHVLCEKPMAISSAECRRMIDACRRADVKLMIAYRVHYDTTFKHIRELIRSGAFGDIQTCLGGFYGQKKTGEWRLNRKLAGGGSLMDLGIYPLNAIRWLVGEEPSEYKAMVSTREKGPRFAEVEQTVEWLIKFPSGIMANCGSSYGQTGPAFLQIDGTKGSVHIEPAFYYGDVKYTFSGTTADGPIGGTNPVTTQFTAEADHFADCILNNHPADTPGEEGLADLIAMEAIYKAAGAPIA